MVGLGVVVSMRKTAEVEPRDSGATPALTDDSAPSSSTVTSLVDEGLPDGMPPAGSVLRTSVDSTVTAFRDALGSLLHGDAAAVLALWSTRDDITIANPFGPPQCGWENVVAAHPKSRCPISQRTALVRGDRSTQHRRSRLRRAGRTHQRPGRWQWDGRSLPRDVIRR